MKLIQAIVQPSKEDAVRDAVVNSGVSGMTSMEARGYGRQWGHKATYRGAEYDVAFTPKVEVLVTVPDHEVDRVVESIMEAARTGQIGDGKIFITPVDQALRIRTGEVDDTALTHET